VLLIKRENDYTIQAVMGGEILDGRGKTSVVK